MSSYTYTNLTQNLNLTSLTKILESANNTTENWFYTGMLWMFIIIVFIISSAFGFEIALLLSFGAGFFVAFMLLYLHLISIISFGMILAILIMVIVYLMYSSNRNQ